MPIKERVAQAAIRILRREARDEILGLLTLDALRDEMKDDRSTEPVPAPRTMRTHFSTAGDFDRTKVLIAALDEISARIRAVSEANTRGYLQAAETVTVGEGIGSFYAALGNDLGEFEMDALDEEGIEREFIYYLASAVGPFDSAIQRQMTAAAEINRTIYTKAYIGFLEVLNRKLATGVEMMQVIVAVSGYLEGIALYERQGIPIRRETVVDTILRIFWSHSTPLLADERLPVEELFASINSNWRAPKGKHRDAA